MNNKQANLKFLQTLTAEQAALVSVGIYDCETISEATAFYDVDTIFDATSIFNQLIEDSELALRKEHTNDFSLTPLCIHDPANAMSLELSDLKFSRASIAEWLSTAGHLIFACRIDPYGAGKSTSIPKEVKTHAKIAAKKQTDKEHTQATKTPCMRACHDIYDKFYADLRSGESQPKKEYILATIKELYPSFSENEVNAIYLITRRNKDSSQI